MGRWLLGRLGRALLAAWGIASVVFLLLHLLPSPSDDLPLGNAGDLSLTITAPTGPAGSHLTARNFRQHRLGLDVPIFYVGRPGGRWHWNGTHNRYHQWLSQLGRGELGRSYRTNQPVVVLLAPALAYSIPLMALAAGLAIVGGIGLALVLAAAPGRRWRAVIRTTLTTLQASPLFALALGLLLLLANPDVLDVLPANGTTLEAWVPGSEQWWLAYGAHLVLPVLCLVLTALPELALPLAAALHHELAAGYATTARAKGLTMWEVTYRHALPNALLPLLATFVGLLPALVAGAVVVEVLFALPGTGRLLADATATHDYPVVVAGVLLAAAIRLLAWLLADVLYFWADPRLRTAS